MPDATFVGLVVLVLAVSVVWPLVAALRQGRWFWAVAIVLLAPGAGLLWLALALWDRLRRPSAPVLPRNRDHPSPA